MKDQKNEMDLSKRKKVVGRPTRFDKAMTGKERVALYRLKIKTEIENQAPESWSEDACIEVLTKKKYAIELKNKAWTRIGFINGWLFKEG